MRIWFELEDQYWHTHFAQQPFYVSGRGYDQYRPALSLGWVAALQSPDAEYGDLQPHLEQQWARDSGTSLLPWREVRAAVQAAWVHAREQAQLLSHPQPQPPVSPWHSGKHVRAVVRPLYFGCDALAQELRHLAQHVALSDFAGQVLQRHVLMLQEFAEALHAVMHMDAVAHKVLPWSHGMLQRWGRLKARLSDLQPDAVFALCEERERVLLGAYRTVLSQQEMPADLRKLLEQQAKRLKGDRDKLQWVRKNWALSAARHRG